MNILNDKALKVAQMAMNGLSQRQNIIAQNVANIDTPGYKAQKVSFESELGRVISRQKNMNTRAATTHPGHLSSTPSRPNSFFTITARQGMTERADGNNVDIDIELAEMTETGLKFEAITNVTSKKLLYLRDIASRR